MERLAGRQLGPDVRHSDEHDVTVVTTGATLDDIATEAFTEIGRYGVGDPRVVARVLQAVEATVAAVRRNDGAPERAAFLVELADDIARPAIEQARTSADKRYLTERLDAIRVG